MPTSEPAVVTSEIASRSLAGGVLGLLLGAVIGVVVGAVLFGFPGGDQSSRDATMFWVATAVGAVAGYVQGWFDAVSMRVLDALLAFPAILLAIVILAVLGPGILNAMLAVAIVNIPAFARLARANVLGEKQKDYVLAGRAVGSSTFRILSRAILPNTLATIIVRITVGFAGAVLLESSLSFLGLGVPLPAPSWADAPPPGLVCYHVRADSALGGPGAL